MIVLALSIPYNNETVDYISWVTQSIQDLVTSGSPVFTSAGSQLLTALAVIMLAVYGIKWAAASASGHHGHFDLPGAIHFFSVFVITLALLKYYSVPLPWTESSVKSILPDTATQFAAAIDLSSLDTFNTSIHDYQNNLEQPPILNLLGIVIYLLMLGFLVVLQGVMFCVNVLGMVAVGLGSLLGPIFIPWLVIPKMSWLFWNWFSFMLTYSFYRVLASALTFIWTHAFNTFITNGLRGDYTLDHALILLPAVGVLCFGMLYSVFKISAFASDLFRGTASAGSSFGSTVQNAIGKGISKL